MRSILSLPYAQRRIVLVAPSNSQEIGESTIDWKTVATTVLTVTWSSSLLGALWNRLRPKRPQLQGAVAVSLEQARSELVFPPGHPLLDHAYVGHPVRDTSYTPFASFHQLMFEQKVSDLTTLLASLGAERVRVRYREGYRSGAGIRLAADVPEHPSGDGRVERHQSTLRDAVFEETYESTGTPAIPSGLVWFEHEPSWQALARRRLEFGTKTFSAELTYTDDFGVDADIKVGIDKLGIRVGGSFARFESTRWEFEGSFRS